MNISWLPVQTISVLATRPLVGLIQKDASSVMFINKLAYFSNEFIFVMPATLDNGGRP